MPRRKADDLPPVERLGVIFRDGHGYSAGPATRPAGAPLTTICVCGQAVRVLSGGSLTPHGCDFTCEGTRAPLTVPAPVPNAAPTPPKPILR